MRHSKLSVKAFYIIATVVPVLDGINIMEREANHDGDADCVKRMGRYD